MAIIKEAKESRLLVIVQTGLSATGQPVLRTRSFSRVRPEARDADIYDVALTIADLQQHPVTNIHRIDDGELIEQP